jgi:hypothetical protein
MRQKSEALETAEQHVRDIRRATWRMYLAEKKKCGSYWRAFSANIPSPNCAA